MFLIGFSAQNATVSNAYLFENKRFKRRGLLKS
jgi:hypothetical protein